MSSLCRGVRAVKLAQKRRLKGHVGHRTCPEGSDGLTTSRNGDEVGKATRLFALVPWLTLDLNFK